MEFSETLESLALELTWQVVCLLDICCGLSFSIFTSGQVCYISVISIKKKKISLFKQNKNQPFILLPYPSLVIMSVFCVHEFVFCYRFTYKGDHMVFVLLCLTYLIYHNILKAHLCCDKWKALFFFNGWITFHFMCMCVCVYATISLFIYPLMDI